MRRLTRDSKGRLVWSRRAVLQGGAVASGALLAGCRDSSPAAMLSPADAGKKDSGRDLGSAEAGGTPDGGAGDVGGPSPTTDASSIDTRPVETGSPDAGAPDTATPQPKPDTAPVVEAAPPEAAPPAPPVENPPPEFPVAAWLREARIAGVDGSLEPEELAVILDACVAQGVSVIEFDSILSHYLTDAEFEAEAQSLDIVAKAAASRGLKSVIYYPCLETLTPQVATAPGSMSKDHADWMQIDMNGKPNVFIGGEGRVFWVEPGTESAWTCPNSPYADYFANRVARLAKTALNGLWGDVPLLADIVGVWPCICRHCKARFQADTGLATPTAVDWSSPTFRRWVVWRHKVIWSFEQKVAQKAREARADFETIIETVTMDYSGSTVQGLDGASHDDGKVLRVWEVDACSDKSAMRDASAADWLDMAAMMKHGAGASAPRPSWVFCYGELADDAERVFALAVATGNNPFELKIPNMTTSVSAAYRNRVFNWCKGETAFFAAYPRHQVAVLYSSSSRDFLDKNAGTGLYSSLNSADPLWWGNSQGDTAAALAYVGDYRGWQRALIHSHVPYDCLPVWRATADTLARYRMVIVPSAVSLSDATIAALAAFASNGGTLIASGGDLGSFDENGGARSGPALLTTLGVAGGAWASKSHGAGRVVQGNERLGHMYLRGENTRARMELAMALPNPPIVSDAPQATVFSTRRTRDGKLMLAAANLDNLGTTPRSFTPRNAAFKVALGLDGWKATAVVGSQPGAGKAPIAFEMKDGRVHFPLSLGTIAIATITLA